MEKNLARRPFDSLSARLRRTISDAQMEKLWIVCFLLIVFPVFTSLLHWDSQPLFSLLTLGLAGLAYLLLLLKVYIWDDHSAKTLLLITAALGIMALSVLQSGMRMYFSTFLLVFSARGIDFRKICRVYFRFFLICFVICFALYFLGLTQDGIETRNNGAVIRHGYGFGHPNSLGFWCLLMVLSSLLAFPEAARSAKIALPLALIVWAYYVSDSRTAVLCAGFAIILCCLLAAVRPSVRKPDLVTLPVCALVLAVFAAIVIISLHYDKNILWMKQLNRLFSTRLVLSQRALEQFGISPMGSKVEPDFPVDVFVVFSLIRAGLIPTVLYTGLILTSLVRAGRKQQWDVVVVGIAAILYLLMESSMMNPVNPALFLCTASLDSADSQPEAKT